MNAAYTGSYQMQRGYIILIAGAVLLISGIAISAVWAAYFAGTIIRENAILSRVSIKPAGSVNVSTQVIDTSRPVTLAINVERNNSTCRRTNTNQHSKRNRKKSKWRHNDKQ